MTASTVPVPRDGLGIEGHNDTEVFAHPVEDEACDPEVITHLNPFAWSHLELPLQGGGVTGSVVQRQPTARHFPPPYALIVDKTSGSEPNAPAAWVFSVLSYSTRHLKQFTWAGITSALVPPIFTPAYRHAR